MEAKELVGKWIESEVLTDTRDVPADTAYRVVGYHADMNAAIVDAGPEGWKGLDQGDFVAEKCETYWYILSEDITKVL